MINVFEYLNLFQMSIAKAIALHAIIFLITFWFRSRTFGYCQIFFGIFVLLIFILWELGVSCLILIAFHHFHFLVFCFALCIYS